MPRQIRRSGSEAEILLVDDNPGDVRLVKELLSDARITNPVHVATGGREALDFVHRRGEFTDAPLPDVILLDWHLSRVTGERVLRDVDDDPELSDIVVIVLTGTRMESGSIVPPDLDVDGYLRKPIDPDEFCSLLRSFERFSLATCSAGDRNQ